MATDLAVFMALALQQHNWKQNERLTETMTSAVKVP